MIFYHSFCKLAVQGIMDDGKIGQPPENVGNGCDNQKETPNMAGLNLQLCDLYFYLFSLRSLICLRETPLTGNFTFKNNAFLDVEPIQPIEVIIEIVNRSFNCNYLKHPNFCEDVVKWPESKVYILACDDKKARLKIL